MRSSAYIDCGMQAGAYHQKDIEPERVTFLQTLLSTSKVLVTGSHDLYRKSTVVINGVKMYHRYLM